MVPDKFIVDSSSYKMMSFLLFVFLRETPRATKIQLIKINDIDFDIAVEHNFELKSCTNAGTAWLSITACVWCFVPEATFVSAQAASN